MSELLRYKEQFATDLQANRAAQQSLRDRLALLVHEETWLTQSLASLEELPQTADLDGPGDKALSGSPEETTAVTPKERAPKVPSQQRSARSGRPGKTKPQATGAKGAGTPKKAAVKSVKPPLWELVGTLLDKHTEPRSVKEITTEFNQVHADRKPASPELVRNALNSLVAKSKAERVRQGKSVMYVATAAVPDDGSSSDTGEEMASALA